MIFNKEQKLILHDIENKFSNIVPNAELLRTKVFDIYKKGEATEEEIKEIESLNDLLDDYFLDSSQLLLDCLKIESKD